MTLHRFSLCFWLSVVLLILGCGGRSSTETGGASTDSFSLLGAPLLWAPTANTIGINSVLESGSPEHLLTRVRKTGDTNWNPPLAATVKGDDVAEWIIDGLATASSYEYEIRAHYSEEESLLHSGSFTTQRPAGEAFTFSLLADSHIGANLSYGNQGDPAALMAVAEDIARYTPDFMVNLGDILDFHMFGFNDPPPDGTYTRQAYLN